MSPVMPVNPAPQQPHLVSFDRRCRGRFFVHRRRLALVVDALYDADLVPRFLIDDPQLRHILSDDIAVGVLARNPPPCFGILDVAEPVPD